MKSGKQRRSEIKEKRRNKAMKNEGVCVYSNCSHIPKNAIKSDPSQFADRCYIGLLPMFYLDKAFACRDCGSQEIWTAKQQKWWYEIIKANIDSTAVRCRRCRQAIRDQKDEQKVHMEKIAKTSPHPNEAFFKKRMK